MGNVAEIKRQRLKKMYYDTGLDYENLRFCFNPYQFKEAINKIAVSDKRADQVLIENSHLYNIGYFIKKTNQIFLTK